MILDNLFLELVAGGDNNKTLLTKLETKLKKKLIIRLCENPIFESDKNSILDLKYITIHNTGNYHESSNANGHSQYLSKVTDRGVNWHFTVDDKQIFQHFSDLQKCHHTGTVEGNNTSIGIEICVNFGIEIIQTSNIDTANSENILTTPIQKIKEPNGKFKLSCENTALLVSYLLVKHDMDMNSVVPHNFWRDTDCPREIMNGTDGVTWLVFMDMIRENLGIPKDNKDIISQTDEELKKIMGQ